MNLTSIAWLGLLALFVAATASPRAIAPRVADSNVATFAVNPPPPPVNAAFDQFGLPNTPTAYNVPVTNYAFLASIGWDIWPRNNGNRTQLANMMTYLGARWARATIGPNDRGNSHTSFVNLANDLNAADPNLHFKVAYILDAITAPCRGCDHSYTTATIGDGANPQPGTEIYAMVQMADAGTLKIIEGLNEIDNFNLSWNGVEYGGVNCNGRHPRHCSAVNGMAQFQAYLYSQVRANHALDHIAVTTPTHAGGMAGNWGLQYGTVIPCPTPSGLDTTVGIGCGTQFADVLAIHPYRGPVNGNYFDGNSYWDCTAHTWNGNCDNYPQDFNISWAGHYPGMTWAQLDATAGVITEDGAVSVHDGNTDENQQGLVALDLFIEGFFSGCGDPPKTVCGQGNKIHAPYSLVDNDGGFANTFGAFKAGSFTPKAEATYIHNLTTVLNDTTSDFTLPAGTDWAVNGCGVGGAQNHNLCHGGLLASSNQHLWLLQTYDWRWQTPADITVQFGQTFAHVNVFDPTVGVNPIATADGQPSYAYTNDNGAPKIFEMWN